MATRTQFQRQAGSQRNEGGRTVRSAAASPLMETLMRLGYAVRGLVYGVIGIVALQVALGKGSTLDDPQGAIVAMGQTPLGKVALYVVLIGLIGYALWGIIRALFDPLHKGSDTKGLVERFGFFLSGLSYGFLAFATYALITGSASAARNGGQTAQTQQAAASIMSQSWGSLVVGILGLIVMGVGLMHIVNGFRGNFDQQFQPYALTGTQHTWLDRLGRFGTAARGLVFALVGVFLFLAAYNNNPRQAQGIDGVLAALLHQPYGPILLGVVALGLIAFGIYSAVSGSLLRFRR